MKRLNYFVLVVVSLLICSCAEVSQDDIIKIYDEIDALKVQIGQINTNISSLQTVLNAAQNQDYVTSVSPINRDGAEIGYIISFQKNGPVTIYHGKDGAAGKDGSDGQPGAAGKDGNAPVIGARQYTDGQWYWTLDGEWMKDDAGNMICANGKDGANGSDGQPGEDGKPGSDGQPGADGTNGSTPQLKIDGGYWYISYDDSVSWKMVGPATGEAGASGDSMFQSVNTGNADYVVFTLVDGTQIKMPTWNAFETLKAQCSEMNTNISSLQEIVGEIQNGGYVKSVTPVYNDSKEAGYSLTLSNGTTVTIFHGKDGADGQPGEPGTAGKDGATPAIGVRQHTDGMWYWTLNGEWLKDGDDNMVCANGKDGQPGKSGADGTNGVTPQMKIETGYWYISYDNGENWTQLGKATGEDGAAGDSFFRSVDVSNDKYVSFVLQNGTELKLQRFTDLSIEFSSKDDIEIEPGQTINVTYTITGSCDNPRISVIPQDGWKASINRTNAKEGRISITAPKPYKEGSVTVLVGEGAHTAMEILTFCEVEISVTSVSLNMTEMMIGEGLSRQITATVLPDDAADKTVIWTSSDENVATVSNTGIVTGINIGEATITAKAGHMSATCTVSVDPFFVGPNLSIKGTANCYVVTVAGEYYFDSSVMGNGPEGYLDAWVESQMLLGTDQSFYLYPESPDFVTFTKSELKRARPAIIWEEGDCIEGEPSFVSADKAIAFKANGNKGAALIGLYTQYDELIWSWLIWCTDRPAEFTYTNTDGDQVKLMDRNIGATSVNPEDGRATFGYCFNFGRKDPIRMSPGMAKTVYIENSSKSYYETVINPTKCFYYVGRDTEYFNGSVNTITPDLWGDPYFPFVNGFRMCTDQTDISDVKKTIYDPCPPGYQVPPGRVFDNIKKSDLHLVSNLGVNLDVEDGTTYFPFAGYGDKGDSHGQDNGWYGYPGFTNNGYREGIYVASI